MRFFKKLDDFIKVFRFKDEWASLMFNLNVLNHDGDSYGPNDIEYTGYGMRMVVKIPYGFDFEHFLTLRAKIETAFNCRLICNYRGITSSSMSENDLIDCELIDNIRFDISYSVVKTGSPNKVYIANDYKGDPIIVDLAKWPGILIAGAQRSGKTKMLQMIIANILNVHGRDKAQFYLYQIDRSDLFLLKKHATEFVSGNYEKMLESLRRLEKIMDKRDKVLRPLIEKGIVSNYIDYNNIERTNDRGNLIDIFVAIDEMASLQSGSKDTRVIREEIVSLLYKVARIGTGLGVHLLTSLQRSDSNSLDTNIKSLCACRVAFRANNAKSSEVMVDDMSAATGLKEREFVYLLGNEYKYGIVPVLNTRDFVI